MSMPVPSYDDLVARAGALVALAARLDETIVTAESCTGGLLAALLTEIAGSSKVLERGFVTYSNEAKAELLDVPTSMIASHGAVSEAVARSMASGALAASRASIAISITGIAGPGGGSAEKPVGLVHFGGARAGVVVHRWMSFGALDRRAIRFLSVAVAFDLLTTLLTSDGGQDVP